MKIMEKYCKVVIVDDEFTVRQEIKHMLDWEKEGYQIAGEAADGREGLALIEETRPDIVLADIVMPVLDGIEFSRILKNRYPEIQLIMLSSYDKFAYVKETLLNGAADYILKPALNPEMLLKTLNHVAEKIPGMQIHKTMHTSYERQMEKYLLGHKERLEQTMSDGVFPYPMYRITGTNIACLCRGNRARMARVERMQREFYAAVTEYVSVPVLMDEEYLCFILNYRSGDEEKVKEDIRSCTVRVKEEAKGIFQIVSNPFFSMDEIRRYYTKEVLPFIDRKFYYPGTSLLFVPERAAEEKEQKFAFEEYSSALLHRQFRTALDMLSAYSGYMCRIRMDEKRLKNITKNLLYCYLMEMEQYGIPAEDLKRTYFRQLELADYEPEYRQVMGDILENLRKMYREKLGVDDIRLQEIKAYIGEHYSENLELTDIAGKFGFNYYYLSSWFNKQSREGFSEYLNRIRIGRACELLREDTGYSIAEIGMKVGYQDQSYFSRVFKKLTRETPSSYRKKYAGKKDY